jgi:HK97 family phage major capsid protein/HK97 family phage prohead protease
MEPKMATDFPTKGDDKKISLRNSNYPQFDYDFAAGVKENNKEVWDTGGNIRGNEAFNFWTKARDGEETQGTLDWIKEREAWAARHFEDGAQFKDGDLEPNKSNIGGVVAQMKWGVIGTLGEQGMKDAMLELIKKLEGKKDDERAFSDLSDEVQQGLRNKVDEHNEEVGDAKTKRTNVRTLATVFERGIGAYKTNPASVRPNVSSPEQWAYARVNSFLFALRNGRFQGGKHDTDLLPLGHPLSTKERDMADLEQRHIQNVEETDDAYIITFGKSMPETEERPYHDEDEDKENKGDDEKDMERLDRSEMVKRYHSFDADRAVDEDTRRVRIGVSSEEPVERDFGMEVIDHSRESMNLDFLNSGRAPLLLDHDMTKQIGVVETVEMDEDARRLRAVVRFGKGEDASEVFNDVRDGIRQNISVGYRIDGRVEREEDDDEIVRVRTTPMEISIVSVPADQSSLVGVGRSVSEPLQSSVTQEIKMTDTTENQGIDLDAVKAEAVRTARKNDSEILAIAAKHNKRDLGETAIRDGLSVDQFRGALLDVIGDDKPLDAPANVIDAPVKETRKYSLGRMVKAQATGDWREAGLEREINDEITRQVGRSAEGVYVPDFAWQQRGPLSTAATGGSGAEVVFDDFVPTEHRGDMFIEALRARQVLGGLGTTYLSGLTGRIKMPKLATGANAAFVEELADVADGAGTDGGVTLQPRTMGAFVEMSRLLVMESVPAIEQIIRNDLLASAADRTEFYAINGSGSGGQPTGILNTSGINNLDISSGTDVDALTWADIIALVKLVEEDNGIVNSAAAGFLSHPAVKAKLASTAKVSSTDSVQILDAPWTELYGQPIEFTSNVPTTLDPGDGGNDASALIYGDFSQLMIAQFGAPSILIDPYSNSKSGTIRMVLHAELDVGVRNAVSFAKTDEVSIA